MSDTQTSNETTDRTNDVSGNVIAESHVTIVNDDPVEEVTDTNEISTVQKEKVNYEVVFFANYNTNPRPSVEEITNFFNGYGVVHHVNCPEGRTCAFVFMSSLNTTAEHRRTRNTISQIIQDMTPENRFRITVASSNRGSQLRTPRKYPYYNRGFQMHHSRHGNFGGNRNTYGGYERNYDGNYDRSYDRGHDRGYDRSHGSHDRNQDGSNQGSGQGSGLRQREYRRPFYRNGDQSENTSEHQTSGDQTFRRFPRTYNTRHTTSGTYRTHDPSYVRDSDTSVRRGSTQRTGNQRSTHSPSEQRSQAPTNN